MLRILAFLMIFIPTASSSANEGGDFDAYKAVKKFKENTELQKKIINTNKSALKAKPIAFRFNEKSLHDSELATEALGSLIKDASDASKKIKSVSHGEMTTAQYQTGIADEVMAEVRYETLINMGINPHVNGYIFVSESMSESLIRAYSRDATRLGMSLVFNGIVDKGSIENKFIQLSNKYHTKRNQMALQVDTRLFDAFNIKKVPAIVVTDIASMELCNETGPVKEILYKDKKYSFNACNKAPENRFCKISGSVFTDWGIKKMSDGGCGLASNFLSSIKQAPGLSQNNINLNVWDSYIKSYRKEQEELSEYEKEVYKMMQGDFK
jgi:conjugal transfer pilus assembly protein TrbC